MNQLKNLKVTKTQLSLLLGIVTLRIQYLDRATPNTQRQLELDNLRQVAVNILASFPKPSSESSDSNEV